MRSYTSSRRPFILVAFIIATIYVVARRRIRVLASQPVICGLAYGVIAYLVMNYAGFPSRMPRPGGPFVLPVFIHGVAIHAFGGGLPSAWFAARAAR